MCPIACICDLTVMGFVVQLLVGCQCSSMRLCCSGLFAVAATEAIPVFGMDDSPAFVELVGLMRLIAEPSTGDTLYKMAVTLVFTVAYAACTHALKAKAPTKLLMQRCGSMTR